MQQKGCPDGLGWKRTERVLVSGGGRQSRGRMQEERYSPWLQWQSGNRWRIQVEIVDIKKRIADHIAHAYVAMVTNVPVTFTV